MSAQVHHSVSSLQRITMQNTNVSRQLFANCKWSPRLASLLPHERLPTHSTFWISLPFQHLQTAHLSARSNHDGATSRSCTCKSGAIQQVVYPESLNVNRVHRLITNVDNANNKQASSFNVFEHLSIRDHRSCLVQISSQQGCDMNRISSLFGSILAQGSIFSEKSVTDRRALTTLSKSFRLRFVSSDRASSSASTSKTQATVLNESGKGSGMPFEIEQDRLLVNPKANKRIKINACGQIYAELCKTEPSLYSKAPKGKGIDFDVSYYDSLELLDPVNRSKAPVVCLLHGAPGHYKDFASLISHMTNEKVRVIAPTFPDYSFTFEYSFRHSPPERLDYLRKFFEALNISKIDMLIGHSSSVYTIFSLLDQTLNSSPLPEAASSQKELSALQVKSLGLFSTPTYNLPPNMVVTPFRLFTLKLFDYPLVRPVILTLIHTFVRLSGIRNKVDKENIESLLIAASAIGYSGCENMQNHLKLISKFKIPTFVLIGCQDKLIPMRCFEQLKRDLGITSEKQVKQYHENGQLAKGASELNELIEVSQFASGGHYTFQKFSRQVNEDVCNFLRRRVMKLIAPATCSPYTLTDSTKA